jgi:hypothetical protein
MKIEFHSLSSRCLETLSFISIVVAFLDFHSDFNILCIKSLLFWYRVRRKEFKVEKYCQNVKALRSR